MRTWPQLCRLLFLSFLDWPTTAPLCPSAMKLSSKQEPWAWGVQTLPPQSQSCPFYPAWVATHTSRNFPPSLPLRADCNPQYLQSGYQMTHMPALQYHHLLQPPPPSFSDLVPLQFLSQECHPCQIPISPPLLPTSSRPAPMPSVELPSSQVRKFLLPLSQQAYLLPWSQILIVLFVCVPDKLRGPTQWPRNHRG